MKYKPLLLSPLGLIPMGLDHAGAADVSMPVKVKAPQATSYTPSWAGFYGGINLGVVADHSSQTGFKPAEALGNYCFGGGGGNAGVACNFSNSQTATGVIGGVQIGYNFQNGAWVYGLEADIDLSSARKTVTGPVPAPYAFFGNWTAKTGIEALGTARLRLGYAFDRAMLYVTGGLAYAKMANTFQAGTGGSGYSWSDTGWRAGYAVGGGLEYQLTDKISIKGEGLFYDLGHKDHISTSGSSQFGLTDKMTGVVGRIGLNYLFH
jgi:outer membrane immunogenic protein